MNNLKKVVCFGLVTAMMCTVTGPVYASSGENVSIEANVVEDIEMPTESTISYIEEREDGTYYISEEINGNNIESTIYKIENGEKIFSSIISSTIQEGRVICAEEDANGNTEEYTVSANIESSNQSDVSTMAARSKTYLRTEKYGISLVGKKVTIAIAAGAIVAVTSYVSLPVAVKIITAAIAGGAGSGVSALPDYLYVTSKVYTSKSAGKMYTRYENKYYLNSARTKYVGSWSFSRRWGH